jgi:flagellin FlaB
MFDQSRDSSERGQVGIGTLIVFIAMVLVAAIAAGVLINTAGNLQSQASDTGSETQEAVANQIEVIHATGDVTASSEIDNLDLVVKKSSGANVIDLTAVTIHYTSSDDDTTFVHSTVGGGSTFQTSDLTGSGSSDALINTSDRVEISITPPTNLTGGDDATINIVDQSGAQYTYGVSVPATIESYDVVEV